MVLEQLNKECKKKKNLDVDLTPSPKINSKWITDLKVKHKTVIFLEDNIGQNLYDLGNGFDFFDITPAQSTKEIIDKAGLH